MSNRYLIRRITISLTLIILLTSAGLLSACAPAAAPAPEELIVTQKVEVTRLVESTRQVEVTRVVEATPLPKEIVLDFGTIVLGGEGGANEHVQKFIAEWEGKHPGVKINWIDTSKPRETYQTALAAGDPIDVMDFHNTFGAATFADMGAFANLDELMTPEQKKWAEDTYVTSMWNGDNVHKGIHYGVPLNAYVLNLWYNRDLFQKAGLDPDKPPMTWEDAFAMGKTIHDKTGAYGLAFYDSAFYLPLYFYYNGVDMITKDGGTDINSERAFTLMKMLKKAYDEGAIPPEAASGVGGTEGYTRDDYEWFGSAYTAMKLDSSYMIWVVSPDEVNIDVSPALIGERGTYPFGEHYLVVSQASPYKELALDFAMFVSDVPQTQGWNWLWSMLPTTKAGQEDYQKNATPDKLGGEKGYKSMMLEIKGSEKAEALPSHPQWDEMLNSLVEQTDLVLLNKTTPEKALETVEKAWTALLSGE